MKKRQRARPSKTLPAGARARSGKSRGGDNAVGRGRPPKHTRFAKGRSGNPKGRPKGSKNLSTIIMAAAGDTVTANIAGKERKISKLQAAAMQLATKAAGGDPTAMARFLDWVDEIEARNSAAKPSQYPFDDEDLEVLQATYDRMKQYKPKEPSDE